MHHNQPFGISHFSTGRIFHIATDIVNKYASARRLHPAAADSELSAHHGEYTMLIRQQTGRMDGYRFNASISLH